MANEEQAGHPWNWCWRCQQTIGDDMRTGEFRDGSECTCIGCGTVYVATCMEDGTTWHMIEQEDESFGETGDPEADKRREQARLDANLARGAAAVKIMGREGAGLTVRGRPAKRP